MATVTQNNAARLAKQGYGVIPLHGISKNRETRELECACASGQRWLAKKNRDPYKACQAPGKRPHYRDWGTKWSMDPDEVMEMFDPDLYRKQPINIGAVCGSPTGLFIIDVDGEEGKSNLALLQEQYGVLPVTRTVITGSGGFHYHFKMPGGMVLKNTASTIAAKIDTRGEGGQAVMPPSKHLSGGIYRWADGLSPDDVEIAELPLWFAELNIAASANDDIAKTKSDGPKKPVTSKTLARERNVEGDGWQRFLLDVGDDEGKHGFNDPIGRAILSFVKTEGVDADVAPLLDAIAEAVDAAEKDPAKDRGKYQRGCTYLVEQIEVAKQKVADEAAQAAEDHAQALADADAMIAEIAKSKAWSADGITEILRKLIHAKPLEVAQRVGALTGLKIGGLTKDLLTGELNRLRSEAGEENEETGSAGFLTFRDAAEHLNTYVASILFPGSHKIVVETPRGPRFLSDKAAETWLAKVKYGRGANANQVFPEWLEWEGRPDYIGTDFNPGGTDPDLYNLWQGFATDPSPGNWERIRQHLLCILCAGDVGAFEYAVGWLAQLLQQPHILIGTAWLVVGEEGSGKGIFFDMLRSAIGVHAAEASGEDDLFNDFNDLQANKVLIVADESPVTSNESQNERMRNNITSPTMRHTKKGVDKVEVRNCRHWVCTLNPKKHKVQVAIDDKSRRFFITITDESRNQCVPYFKAFAASADAGGREAMFHDLLRYQCNFDTLRKPYRSAAFGVMAERNFKPEVKWWREVLLNGELPGVVRGVKWDDEHPMTRKALRDSYNAWRISHDLHSLDDVTAGYVFRDLLPIVGKTKVGKDHAYKLPSLEECRIMFEEKYRVPVDPDAEPEEETKVEAITFPPRREEIGKDGLLYWAEDLFEAVAFDLLYAGTIGLLWPEGEALEERLHRHIDKLNESVQPHNWPIEGTMRPGLRPGEPYVLRYGQESERPLW